MTIKQKILATLKDIDDPTVLGRILDYLSVLQVSAQRGNKTQVLSHAGVLTDEEAYQISASIDEEFNSIEGEW